MRCRRTTICDELTKSKRQRLIGAPLWVATRCRRALGLDELAAAVNDRILELHSRVRRRIERLLGQPYPKRRRRQLSRTLSIEQLEVRMVLSAAPVIGLPGGAVNYTEDDPATVIDALATASDTDSADFDTGTLTIDFTAGGTANDRLAIRNEGTAAGQIGVSGSNVTYNFGAGAVTIGTFTGGTDGSTPLVITLNTSSTPVAAQALMRNITYENVSENPAASARTVRFVLTDGDGGTSTAETETVNVTAENDAPVADLNGSNGVGTDYSTTFIEGSRRINITDTDATIADLDHTTYQGLAINLGGFVDGSDEQIRIDNEQFDYGVSDVIITTVGSTDFYIDFDGTGFTITRDGGGTIPEVDLQTLLRSVTYENKSSTPTLGNRTFDFILQDADSLNATPSVSTVTVNSVNDDPSISLPGAAVSYTEGDGAVLIDASATASDTDSADFDTGTLTIDFTAGGTANDRLAIRNEGTAAGQIGVSGSNVTYNFGAGAVTIGTFTGGTDGSTPLVITLNTSSTPVAAQALMRNITYENVSENPAASARTVRFVLTDGDGGASNVVTEVINVAAVTDSPATATYNLVTDSPATATNNPVTDSPVLVSVLPVLDLSGPAVVPVESVTVDRLPHHGLEATETVPSSTQVDQTDEANESEVRQDDATDESAAAESETKSPTPESNATDAELDDDINQSIQSEETSDNGNSGPQAADGSLAATSAYGTIGRSNHSQTTLLTQPTSVRANLLDSVFSESGELFSRLDEMAGQIDQPLRSPAGQFAIASTAVGTAGYALFEIRKVSLLSALFVAAPQWKAFDPLIVLDSLSAEKGAERGNDAGTLLELVEDSPTGRKEAPR